MPDVFADTAMNAAFAVGRLCESEQGRSLILAQAREHQLVRQMLTLSLPDIKEAWAERLLRTQVTLVGFVAGVTAIHVQNILKV